MLILWKADAETLPAGGRVNLLRGDRVRCSCGCAFEMVATGPTVMIESQVDSRSGPRAGAIEPT